MSLGKQAEAIADYEAALKLEPKNSGVLNNLAWVLATSPDDKLRNGKRAIELAKQACEVTEYKQAHILSTLAAGYAETGDFDTAINWSKKAVELRRRRAQGPAGQGAGKLRGQEALARSVAAADDPAADQTAKPEKNAAPGKRRHGPQRSPGS